MLNIYAYYYIIYNYIYVQHHSRRSSTNNHEPNSTKMESIQDAFLWIVQTASGQGCGISIPSTL